MQMTEKNLNKLKARKNRVMTLFNTGTRTHKSKRDYNRKDNKINLLKISY